MQANNGSFVKFRMSREGSGLLKSVDNLEKEVKELIVNDTDLTILDQDGEGGCVPNKTILKNLENLAQKAGVHIVHRGEIEAARRSVDEVGDMMAEFGIDPATSSAAVPPTKLDLKESYEGAKLAGFSEPSNSKESTFKSPKDVVIGGHWAIDHDVVLGIFFLSARSGEEGAAEVGFG